MAIKEKALPALCFINIGMLKFNGTGHIAFVVGRATKPPKKGGRAAKPLVPSGTVYLRPEDVERFVDVVQASKTLARLG